MRAGMWMLMTLVGCGGAERYGSFVDGRAGAQAAIAADAVTKLVASYPPEDVTVELPGETADAFGTRFSAELRKAGYAVKKETASSSSDDLRVRYVLDELKGTKLLRVTLSVDGQTLSRPYAQRGEDVYPAGPWTIEASSAGGTHGQ